MRRSTILITALFSFSLIFHGYIGFRLIPDLSAVPVITFLAAATLLSAALLVPLALIRTQAPDSNLNRTLVWSGFIAMGWVSTLFVATLLRDLFLLLLLLVTWVANPLWISPQLPLWSAWLVITGSALVTLIGLANVLSGPTVQKVDVAIENLPPALHGFRIVQITDIHVGPTIKKTFLQKVVQIVNLQQADVVAITGDLVDGRVQHLGDEVTPLQQLKSAYGTYFVTGNHEYYSNANQWIEHLRALGIRILLNEHVVLVKDDAKLVLAGITDYSAHQFDENQRSNPHAALLNAPPDAGARILLAHQPRSIFQALDAGYHLQLSGHTHGGQFWPWNLFVPLQQPFTAGLHWHQSMWIYTSRGTGYWGPPKRFAAPAEITLIRLIEK